MYLEPQFSSVIGVSSFFTALDDSYSMVLRGKLDDPTKRLTDAKVCCLVELIKVLVYLLQFQ